MMLLSFLQKVDLQEIPLGNQTHNLELYEQLISLYGQAFFIAEKIVKLTISLLSATLTKQTETYSESPILAVNISSRDLIQRVCGTLALTKKIEAQLQTLQEDTGEDF